MEETDKLTDEELLRLCSIELNYLNHIYELEISNKRYSRFLYFFFKLKCNTCKNYLQKVCIDRVIKRKFGRKISWPIAIFEYCEVCKEVELVELYR